MKRITVATALAMMATVLVGCGGDSSSNDSGGETRQVLVDYRHDETETSMFDYYPRKVTVRPGDTVEFEQAWTGEAHSVTFGTIVDPVLTPIISLLDKIKSTGEFPAGGEPEEFQAFDLPFVFEGTEDSSAEDVSMSQQAAQPCFVAEADSWPGDRETPCPKRAQPKFTGSDAVYSSGVIPYEGVGGNTFRVPVAADAKPGTYGYYCNVHGPLQYGQVEIVPKGTDIPSSREVAETARKESKIRTEVMVANYKAAKAGKGVLAGETGEEEIATKGKNLIGVPSPFFYKNNFVHGIINEFVPKQITAKTNEKVTWTFAGKHTISFNVPKYFPVFTIANDGTVAFNPKALVPAGWPGPPKPPEGGGEEPEGGGEGEEGPPPEREPAKVDAGPWDGKGFRSSGLDFGDGDEFSVTFTKAGTYPFACLVHPSMVGTIVVK